MGGIQEEVLLKDEVLEDRQNPIHLDPHSLALPISWDYPRLLVMELDVRKNHSCEIPFRSDLPRRENRKIEADVDYQLRS